MKYYIDLGAFDGDSIIAFQQRKGAKQYRIIAAEPNPDMHEKLEALQKTIKGMVLIKKAAFTHDTKLPFTVDKSANPVGSTLMQSKRNWGQGKIIEVETFDFPALLDSIRKNKGVTYIIVKMDIEGAEFPLLETLHDKGLDQYIDELWVEMHPNKVRKYTTTYSNELLAKLRCKKVVEWH